MAGGAPSTGGGSGRTTGGGSGGNIGGVLTVTSEWVGLD